MLKVGDEVVMASCDMTESRYDLDPGGVIKSWVGSTPLIVDSSDHDGSVYILRNDGTSKTFTLHEDDLEKLEKTMKKTYEVIGGSSFPVGTQITSEAETSSFIHTTNSSGKAIMLPKKYVKEIGATTSSASEEDLLKSLLDSAPESLFEVSPETIATVPPKAPVVLEKGQFLLSTVTGGRLPKSGIDHVLSAFDLEIWGKDCVQDIPVIDPDYYWDADLLEAMWISHKLNKKMLITGWPGTGKTTAVQQFGAWVKQPVMRFNGKDGVEASSFLGNIWATKEGMEWRDGLLPQGMKAGYLVTIDEVFKIPAGIQMAMQNLYEDNGILVLDEKPGTLAEKQVHPEPTFRLFLTDNVKGTGDNFAMFGATQVQDSSTLDRFGITATLEYLPTASEIDMLKAKFPEVKIDLISKLVKFANLVRKQYTNGEISLTLSPRGLQTILQVFIAGLPIQTAIELSFTKKFGDTDEIHSVEQARAMCF